MTSKKCVAMQCTDPKYRYYN